ncbi:dihydrolipoamide acetyltransferase family protein [Pseudonocardia acaciae]|uniref:dihydrolipoamide acetyltransferase family protein n=1 Tax=Pseudonocardia acaciae TaxID=551276 RepID=UPI00048AC1D4|nr:dihydrolipoamide acetyltransferase family protein [Pseudonocardia acaciae]
MSEVIMPRLSDSMEEGTIVHWLKASGEAVRRGDEIVEIETDKATVAHEADSSGVLTIVRAEGAVVPIGSPIARIDEEPGTATSPEDGAAPRPEPTAPGRPASASPVARRLAQKLGVDLAAVTGSGPNGRIVRADVEAAARPATPAPAREPEPEPLPEPVPEPEVEVVALSRARRTIAQRMAETKATVPEFTVSMAIDMAEAVSLRRQLTTLAAEAPSLNDMVVKAAALALREHPRANGAYRDGTFELHRRVNVGIAVAVPDSLLVPTVVDADRKPLTQIAAQTRALAAKARDGRLTPDEQAGGTFTVSNLGMFGVTEFTAIINRGQAGILAVGALADVPVVDAGRVTVGTRLTLTLTCDHRILYGADAAAFLARVRALLETPLALL